jgi:AraC family transcriptional regulator
MDRMLTSSAHVALNDRFARNSPSAFRRPTPLSLDRSPRFAKALREHRDDDIRPLHDELAAGAFASAVEISPADGVKRRAVVSDGMAAEIIQVTRHDRIEFRFRAPCHVLIVYEHGVRDAGETVIEGLPRSTRRDVTRKLTFVPAGYEYRDWQEPRKLARMAFFYFAPEKMPVPSEADSADRQLAPRLFFEDAALWDTALKLSTLIESAGADNRLYLEALGTVLAHEVMRLNAGTPRPEPQMRGGLAAWQQRKVTDHIEQHLAEHIPLATLAQLARLSLYYFCRAFKQSFGVSPHRYHNNRRIELAKTLLAAPDASVTEVGLNVGFSETSSFTSAFRKTTGLTPTAYRRSLA